MFFGERQTDTKGKDIQNGAKMVLSSHKDLVGDQKDIQDLSKLNMCGSFGTEHIHGTAHIHTIHVIILLVKIFIPQGSNMIGTNYIPFLIETNEYIYIYNTIILYKI